MLCGVFLVTVATGIYIQLIESGYVRLEGVGSLSWMGLVGLALTLPMEISVRYPATFARFRADDRQLIAVATNGEIMVWDNARPEVDLIYALYPHDQLTCMRFEPTSSRLVSSSREMLRIWSLESRQPEHIASAPQYVTAVEWSPDGTSILSSGHDGAIHVWDAKTLGHLRKVPHRFHFTTYISALKATISPQREKAASRTSLLS